MEQNISNGLFINRFMNGSAVPTQADLDKLNKDEIRYLTCVWCQRMGLRQIRLMHFKELKAPKIMIQNENKLIKEATEMAWLFDCEMKKRLNVECQEENEKRGL